MTDLPSIVGENDWIDLADGEEAVLKARLDTVMRDGSLLLGFADWSQIVVPIVGDGPFRETGLDRLRREGLGRQVHLAVFRTEDGIAAEADALISAGIAA
jgi:hypothetical protein